MDTANFTVVRYSNRTTEQFEYGGEGNLTHYDSIGRLKAASTPLDDETFAFDSAGNLIAPELQQNTEQHCDSARRSKIRLSLTAESHGQPAGALFGYSLPIR